MIKQRRFTGIGIAHEGYYGGRQISRQFAVSSLQAVTCTPGSGVLYAANYKLFNEDSSCFGPTHRQTVTRHIQADGVAKRGFAMQANFGTGQTTHFKKFERHPLIVERHDGGSFSNFEVCYATFAHGRDAALRRLLLFRFSLINTRVRRKVCWCKRERL